MKNDYILEIEDLTVKYITEDSIVSAVNNMSLKLERGNTLGFVGETGAGKTTTAKSIMRLLPEPPTKIESGKIIFNGENILEKSIKHMQSIRGNKISMIFQDPMTALNPVIPIIDQIAEVILLHQTKDRKAAYKRAEEMLEIVEIKKERGEEYPHQFSGGMKQRVVIAIALACTPDLLIADEPTTALDVTIQAQVLKLMHDIKESNNTSMIMITHDLGIVAEACDNVAVIYAGSIVEYGTKEDIFNSHAHPYTEGLFNCIPDLSKTESELIPIKGIMPDPSDLPTGCKFHPRCPYAVDRCSKEEPESKEISDGHMVKCFLEHRK
ncbi:ABC transporter ATP-binding protein [Sedimentibacter hydroxybenzoicus DSM 7310]|uniref:ABC transporter ATP-binding protein n=1 Tax=Sedimentibacter hydroxybenzoicus DSM 7310 TaxID=1123245 RepID=A0A974BM90_SEDHY|nr:ABC transporter ATP-binding protein [Sedimentibacter hydroxybenzoicus]NYB75287.1 ABC transporter ATP-binding protein [Sedimentibacter hydroxybenzoicus DSM 7310]